MPDLETQVVTSDKDGGEPWLQELNARREESLRIALRNFAVSRMFSTEGSLSASDRLMRFHEGVVMSLEHNSSKKAFEAACHSFEAVLRYDKGGETPNSANPEYEEDGSPDARNALRHQAAYNLAVLYHRRIVQLREQKE